MHRDDRGAGSGVTCLSPSTSSACWSRWSSSCAPTTPSSPRPSRTVRRARPLHVALGGVAVLAGIGLLFAGLSSGSDLVGPARLRRACSAACCCRTSPSAGRSARGRAGAAPQGEGVRSHSAAVRRSCTGSRSGGTSAATTTAEARSRASLHPDPFAPLVMHDPARLLEHLVRPRLDLVVGRSDRVAAVVARGLHRSRQRSSAASGPSSMTSAAFRTTARGVRAGETSTPIRDRCDSTCSHRPRRSGPRNRARRPASTLAGSPAPPARPGRPATTSGPRRRGSPSRWPRHRPTTWLLTPSRPRVPWSTAGSSATSSPRPAPARTRAGRRPARRGSVRTAPSRRPRTAPAARRGHRARTRVRRRRCLPSRAGSRRPAGRGSPDVRVMMIIAEANCTQ